MSVTNQINNPGTTLLPNWFYFGYFKMQFPEASSSHPFSIGRSCLKKSERIYLQASRKNTRKPFTAITLSYGTTAIRHLAVPKPEAGWFCLIVMGL